MGGGVEYGWINLMDAIYFIPNLLVYIFSRHQPISPALVATIDPAIPRHFFTYLAMDEFCKFRHLLLGFTRPYDITFLQHYGLEFYHYGFDSARYFWPFNERGFIFIEEKYLYSHMVGEIIIKGLVFMPSPAYDPTVYAILDVKTDQAALLCGYIQLSTRIIFHYIEYMHTIHQFYFFKTHDELLNSYTHLIALNLANHDYLLHMFFELNELLVQLQGADPDEGLLVQTFINEDLVPLAKEMQNLNEKAFHYTNDWAELVYEMCKTKLTTLPNLVDGQKM
jgi:hypothetical protein